MPELALITITCIEVSNQVANIRYIYRYITAVRFFRERVYRRLTPWQNFILWKNLRTYLILYYLLYYPSLLILHKYFIIPLGIRTIEYVYFQIDPIAIRKKYWYQLFIIQNLSVRIDINYRIYRVYYISYFLKNWSNIIITYAIEIIINDRFADQS